MALALLVATALPASADSWNAVRWQSLFEQAPSPPATLTLAGSQVKLVRNTSNNVQLTLTDPALLQSHADLLAGMSAMNQNAATAAASTMAAGGIDMNRMQQDPAYAEKMQQKMAGMSQAEAMQLAMQMAATQRQKQQAALANSEGMRAGLALAGYTTGEGSRQLGSTESHLTKTFAKLVADYNARHAALDQQLWDALKTCPEMQAECGDTNCPPAPACIAKLNAQVPQNNARHRQLAAEELTAEGKMFATTRAALLPPIQKIASLTTTAEAAGAPAGQRQGGYAAILEATSRMQAATAQATLRAGYWQNIRQTTIPDSYFAGNSGHLGYKYLLDKDEFPPPPTDLPDGW